MQLRFFENTLSVSIKKHMNLSEQIGILHWSLTGLTYTRSVEESKAINDRKEPMIIISASGMAEAGRILHHLGNNIENPRNTVLIVGWQAPYTLGRRLADREKRIKIFGEAFTRRAEVDTIGGLLCARRAGFIDRVCVECKKSGEKDFFGARRRKICYGTEGKAWRTWYLASLLPRVTFQHRNLSYNSARM